jgi:glycosyltransferase involved in cell wall biosynthesis
MAAAEGMASGLPLVCTSSCGVAELVEGSEAGAIVPPGDATALRDAMLPFLEDEDLALAAGRAGRSIVEERCSPQRVAEERERVYEKLRG